MTFLLKKLDVTKIIEYDYFTVKENFIQLIII